MMKMKRFNTDIVKLAGQYTKLKQAGKTDNFIGLCPFHVEKTPSFVVNKKHKEFYCLGCGKGGNYYNFENEVREDPYCRPLIKEDEKILTPSKIIKTED